MDDTKGLIPEKYSQHDLFICDVADAVIKDLMPQLEHPFYSLSKKPETTARRYEHGENWVEIVPAYKGAATIYDKDILIYAISQIIAKQNRGEQTSKKVRINSSDLLRFTNRGTSGRDYMALQDSLDRLDGTRIRTNIVTGDESQWDAFGLIDSASTRRKNGIDGRLLWCEITISDWVYNAIQSKEVLTLHRDYFRLRKPIERRIYEIARKHCGTKKNFKISLAVLHKKSGSRSSLREFKRAVKNTVKTNHLPDYIVELGEFDDMVTFNNRTEWWKKHQPPSEYPLLETPEETALKVEPFLSSEDTIEDLTKEWVNYWIDSGCPTLKSPDRAFIGFCKARFIRAKQTKDAHPLLISPEETKQRAEQYLLPGESVDDLIKQWVDFWIDSGCPVLKAPDGAFIGFCKNRFACANQA